MFVAVSDEVLQHIFIFMSAVDLGTISLVCSRFREIASCETVCKAKCAELAVNAMEHGMESWFQVKQWLLHTLLPCTMGWSSKRIPTVETPSFGFYVPKKTIPLREHTIDDEGQMLLDRAVASLSCAL